MKVPLFHALTERIMIGGIPRKIAICGYKLDAYFLEILAEHIKEDDHLHP
jgi:hypothetical protein